MKYLVYSHTDYIDILRVHADNLKYEDSILLINKSEHNDIFDRFSKVIFYDDNQSYTKKLVQCVSQIDDEYFILIHDMDILMEIDEVKMCEIKTYVIENNIDRLYLHHFPHHLLSNDIDGNIVEMDKFTSIRNPSEYGDVLYKVTKLGITTNRSSSGYGVNPSICKKSSMIDIWEKFPDKTYRNIEEYDVGSYCIDNYNFYFISSKTPVDTGFYMVNKFFKYIHITHYGQLLTTDREMDKDSKEYYINNILNKYKFNR